MFHRLNHRVGHYLLLLMVGSALTLPNLGAPSLWDIDEGHNAECAREMLDSGNWLVPTFNFQLRDHKPPLLYWLQIAAYEWFGVNEFSARLPSALAGLAAVLITYELSRLMFGSTAGLLAGVILASAAMFCSAAHFANPDSLLDTLTIATFYIFWRGLERSPKPCLRFAPGAGNRSNHAAAAKRKPALRLIWVISAAILMGLAVLTKGPVGLLLPVAVIGLFLLWSRQLRLVLDHRLGWGIFAFILVAVPWYVWISAETKGEFTRGFFLTHNFGRFLSPMENHRGPLYYYLVALLLGFAPWSPFLLLAGVYGVLRNWQNHKRDFTVSSARPLAPTSPPDIGPLSFRFLASWIIVYLVFFTLSGTKLPNYILPIYPAAAILTARFLDEWRQGLFPAPNWVMLIGLIGVAVIGLGAAGGLLLAGGFVDLPALRGRTLPGLEAWAFVGCILVVGSALAGWLIRRKKRTGVIFSLAATSILFVGIMAAGGSLRVDSFKAPRPLVKDAGAFQTDRDIRIGCYQFYQPSLVFYCRREVRILNNEDEALQFLRCPLPAFLIVSAPEWESLAAKVRVPHRLLAKHRDLYKNCEVVVVTNQ